MWRKSLMSRYSCSMTASQPACVGCTSSEKKCFSGLEQTLYCAPPSSSTCPQ